MASAGFDELHDASEITIAPHRIIEKNLFMFKLRLLLVRIL
jgi:hypothetical protein